MLFICIYKCIYIHTFRIYMIYLLLWFQLFNKTIIFIIKLNYILNVRFSFWPMNPSVFMENGGM